MAKQMLLDAYQGKKTAKAPWVPYAGVHCAFIINEPADKMLQDPELLAKGIVATAKRYKADGIPLLFDLSVEANAVGCGLKWWPDNVPSVTNHPCSAKTPAEAGLQLPTKESGRWPVIFEAARICQTAAGRTGLCVNGAFLRTVDTGFSSGRRQDFHGCLQTSGICSGSV